VATGILELADQLWRGEADIATHHPFNLFGDLVEIDRSRAFVAAFANVAAFATDDGLVLVDTSSPFLAGRVHDALREWRDDTLHTAVFTHGHIDHVFGVERYESDAREQRRPEPRVIAHELVPARFDRYLETAGYNTAINRRQFGAEGLQWPLDYRYPDETYIGSLLVEVGGTTFELHHARGETDDHTWVWVPGSRTLCTGDLFIWASPNCGNPQKVQRYAKEWAAALHKMATLEAEILLPGHGLPIVGTDRVHEALTNTATLLETLHDETVRMMNEGARLDEIIHTVRAPQHLLDQPYLRPIYDEPEFVVRNVWRLYGGWHDGNPAHLKPAPEAAQAAEIATLAGGADRLAARARQLADAGDLRLAGHLAEWAALAAPDDESVQRARAEVFELRVAAEASTMSKGIFGAAARESRAKSGVGDADQKGQDR
jgi:alkyl sulfatase BDS1-like metallo-beta-lactamase superfamily hydrolase